MKNLFKCELKKFFHPLAHRIVLAFLVLLPLIMLCIFQWNDQRSEVTFDGQAVSLAKGKQLSDELRIDLQGVIDESWLNKTAERLEAYENSGVSQTDLRYQVLSKAFWNGVQNYESREINKTDMQTPKLAQKDLNEHALVYGPYEGWLTYMEVFKCCAIAFAIGCLYLFSDLFNQEDSVGIIDLLKSSRNGRKPLATVKLCIALMIVPIIGALMYGVMMIGASLLLNLQGNQTTAIMFEGSFQIYNFAQISQQALWLSLIGGWDCAIVAAFLSVVSKKPFVSLGGSLLFYMAPTLIAIKFMDTSWNAFFPTSFLSFQSINQLMHNSWVQVNNQLYHRVPTIGVIWLIVILCLIISVFWLHCKSKKHYIIKGWR